MLSFPERGVQGCRSKLLSGTGLHSLCGSVPRLLAQSEDTNAVNGGPGGNGQSFQGNDGGVRTIHSSAKPSDLVMS